jgi:predicted permease
MRLLRRLRLRLRSIFRATAVDEELDRELTLHFEQLVREQMGAGLTEADARRAARHAFGSPVAAQEACRDTRQVGVIEDLITDVRYTLRLLARSPAFAVTTILSLALGIGANTAIFSLVDTVLLRALPVRHPEQLVFIETVGSDGPSRVGTQRGSTNGAPPYPCFERLRRETSAFTGMAAFATDDLRLQVDGRIEQVFGQVASGNYFDVLGLEPAAGRLLSLDDERLDPPVAVISYGYWQRRFGGDPAAIGKTIAFRDRAFTIVGVSPRDFWGLQPGRQVDVTIPITQERRMVNSTSAWWFEAVARLRVDATVERAASEADAVFQSFMREFGPPGEFRAKYLDHVELLPAARGLDGLRLRFSRPLQMLLLVSGIVLLIACANIAMLLQARGAARARELAIRVATGARPGRLLRQMLTETMLLFVLGAAAGMLVAHGAIAGLTAFFAIGRNPIVLDVRYDWRLAAYTGAITLGAGLLTGLWPALRALRADPHAAIKDGDVRTGGSRRGAAIGRLLVASQAGLSIVLLVAASIFVRSMINLRAVDMGFVPSGTLTMSLDPLLGADADDEAWRPQFWRQVLDRVRNLPGVRGASLSVLTPLSGRDTAKLATPSGFRPARDSDRLIHVNHVSEDYFQAFGIRLLEGRTFTYRDTSRAPRVAIINEAAARAWFEGRSAIGQTIDFGDSAVYEVIGVVHDSKHMSVREPAPRFAFIPLWQPLDAITRITLAVSSNEPLPSLARVVTREVQSVYSNTLVSDVISVDEQVDASLVSERLLSALAGWFGALALALAAIGLYGILSQAIARGRVEIGVRMALGASPRRIASGVFRLALLPVAAGVIVGLPIAIAVARLARALLFGVSPADPSSYFLASAALAATATAAAWLPARRACTIDLAETLRRE